MALPNNFNALIVLFLLVSTLPLALLAACTTTLAFAILGVRLTFVAFHLALALLPHARLPPPAFPDRSGASPGSYTDELTATPTAGIVPRARSALCRSWSSSHAAWPLSYRHLYATVAVTVAPGGRSPSQSPSQSPPPSPPATRSRRFSSGAASVDSAGGTATPTPSDAGLGLIPSVGPDRDFEGLGGWSLHSDDENDDGAPQFQKAASTGTMTPGADVGWLMMKGPGSPVDAARPASVSAFATPVRSRAPSIMLPGFTAMDERDGMFHVSSLVQK